MNKTFKNFQRICSVALLSAAFAVPAMAAVHVNFGNVSVGYRDGYQDNHHRWHHWRQSDAAAYRNHSQQNYRDMNYRDDHNRGR
jgi:hypothetical protein